MLAISVLQPNCLSKENHKLNKFHETFTNIKYNRNEFKLLHTTSPAVTGHHNYRLTYKSDKIKKDQNFEPKPQ